MLLDIVKRNIVISMALRMGVVIYGPPKSGKSLLLEKIHELYREAAAHEIRHLGGRGPEGIDYCVFQVGDLIYEFYAPPGSSALKVMREKLIKRASAIIFVIPASKAYLDKVFSFISELKRILFARFGSEYEYFPIIYAINVSRRFISVDLDLSDLIEALELPQKSIIRIFDLDDEPSVRRLFGLVVHLSSLWNIDKKQYFIELEKELKITEDIYLKAALPIEEVLQKIIEALPEERAGQQPAETEVKATPSITLSVPKLSIPDSLRGKLTRNYISDVALIGFDRSVGYVPLGYISGIGRLVNYIRDPARVIELSIVAKHSMGTILVDGSTTIGFAKLVDQGLVVLETTTSHIRKMINIVRELQDKVANLTSSDIDGIIRALSDTLS